MTEEQIERIAEREMDKLDMQYQSGQLTLDEYEEEVNELEDWVRDAYRYRDRD